MNIQTLIYSFTFLYSPLPCQIIIRVDKVKVE